MSLTIHTAFGFYLIYSVRVDKD